MIVYNLSCDNQHAFEGWFDSPQAYAHQHQAGQLSCPVCGSSSVMKLPSAPYVSLGGTASETTGAAVAAGPKFFDELRAKVLEFIHAHSEDVGERFPEEARRIFHEEAPERAIRGKASQTEVAELRDEGIEVVPLPGLPSPPEKLH